jgi:hypothetical protein
MSASCSISLSSLFCAEAESLDLILDHEGERMAEPFLHWNSERSHDLEINFSIVDSSDVRVLPRSDALGSSFGTYLLIDAHHVRSLGGLSTY